jgi:hypothetical protein
MPGGTSAESFIPGTIPLVTVVLSTHVLGSDQLPLWTALKSSAWLIRAKSETDKMVKTARICFVFIGWVGWVCLVEIIELSNG